MSVDINKILNETSEKVYMLELWFLSHRIKIMEHVLYVDLLRSGLNAPRFAWTARTWVLEFISGNE